MTLITRIWNENRVIMAGDDQLNLLGRRIAGTSECKIIFLRELNAVMGISGNLRENDYKFKEILKDIYAKNHYDSLNHYLEEIKEYFDEKRPKELKKDASLLMASAFENGIPKNYSLIFKFSVEQFVSKYHYFPIKVKNWYDYQTCYWVDNSLESESDIKNPFRNIDTNWNYGEDEDWYSPRMFLSLINSIKEMKFTDNVDLMYDNRIINFMKEVYDIAIIKLYDEGPGYEQLISIGHCNGIIVIEKNPDESGFIYMEGKCCDDHIW